MNEVSCRAFWLHLELLRRRRIPPERLAEGLPVTLRELTDPGKRVDWDTMCSLDERVELLCGGPGELERLGALWTQSPFLGVRSFAGLMASAQTMYWVSHRWFGPAMFTITESTLESLPGNRIRFTLQIPEGYRDSPPFFRINAGVFRAIPQLLGQPDSLVEWQLEPRRAVYLIDPPPSLTLLARSKRALRFVFAARFAFNELGAQQEQLKIRYQELQLAHSQIEIQAGQLQTVNFLGRELARYTDVKLLADAVVKLLFERFAASGVAIWLSEQSENADHLAREWGEREGPAGRSLALNAGGQRLGRIDLWGLPPPRAGRSDLLESLVPSISLALENARSFGLLREYQEGLEKKVAERTEQLRVSLQRLTEANRQRSEFFANASHELRTPLTLMLSPLEILSRSELAGENQAEVQSALRNGYRLLKLVNDVLDLSKIEAGQMRLQIGSTDLARVVSECARPWRPAVAVRRIKLEVAVPPSLPMLADVERLEQVVLNLISNAVKNTPDGGSIRVAADRVENGMELTVENEGEGIDPEDVGKLFERFAQSLHSRSRRYGSTGLGLPLVRELVELHGGRITVKNEPGKSVAFQVFLPLGPPSDEGNQPEVLRPGASELLQYQLSSEPEARPPEAPSPANSEKPLLLVAEDSADLRAFIARCLRDDFHIIEADDGRRALALALERLPEVVLTDLMMPGMDGIELCRALKSNPATRATPVVMLTARADIDARLAGFEGGADDYLVKPFHIEEVRARLRSQLRLRRLSEQVAHAEKLAALGTMVAGVAHELRNPLNGIINSLAPLKQALSGASPEVTELLDLAILSSERVDHISAQLLQQARTDLGIRTRVDLARNVGLALQLLGPKLSRGPAVKTRIAPGPELAVDGEPGSLNQVWMNLIDNAVQAAGPSGHVEVAISRNDEQVLVEVVDDGPGIEPRFLKRIFDPFFTTKPIGQGTGLGLALVRDIVRRHGGTVSVDSRPGEGSRFTVALPATERRPSAAA